MEYKLNFGTRAAAIPSRLADFLACAGEIDVKTVLYLCAVGGECEADEIASAIGVSVEKVNMSLAFWRGAGIILSGDERAEAKKPDTPKKSMEEKVPSAEKTFEAQKPARADKLPEYTAKELAVILEQREGIALLIAEGQQILGKIFTVHEVNLLIGLADYLELENDYILMLLKYCAEIGKKTLHYAEKAAISLYDMGITNSASLAEELERREAVASAEGQIRSIFGIGARALTTKEKKEISAWINDMKAPIEVIEKAYEVTCDAVGKPSLHYANSVIERWHAEGLLTIEQIEASYKEKGKEGASFETDEFFEAAVRRSLGEK